MCLGESVSLDQIRSNVHASESQPFGSAPIWLICFFLRCRRKSIMARQPAAPSARQPRQPVGARPARPAGQKQRLPRQRGLQSGGQARQPVGRAWRCQRRRPRQPAAPGGAKQPAAPPASRQGRGRREKRFGCKVYSDNGIGFCQNTKIGSSVRLRNSRRESHSRDWS